MTSTTNRRFKKPTQARISGLFNAMPTLFIDIETIPTDRQDVREYIAAKVTPPATMSKPETIAKWEAESKPAAIDEAVAKTGLDGAFGCVCVIGWAVDDGEVKTMQSVNNEATLLDAFGEAMNQAINYNELFDTVVCGHNVSAFDLRFLMQRYMVHGIKPPQLIKRAAEAKPWETQKVFDTMVQWAGVGNRVSLEKLCLAFGIESPKGEIDGSNVAQAVADGRIDEVAAYCKRDVEATRAIYKRMNFWG
jgi:3'-5' exonuclease